MVPCFEERKRVYVTRLGASQIMPFPPRSGTVPGTFAESLRGRWFWWGSAIINAFFAGLWSYAAFRDDWEWQSANLVFSGLAIAWWALVSWTYVVILFRPRHSARSLDQAFLQHSATGSVPAEVGAFIPGSARISAAIACVALAWTIAFTLFAVAAETGWRIFWIVCASLVAVVFVDKAFNVKPRWLLLSPEYLYASGSRQTAGLRWSEIGRTEFVQGHDGLMVLRIHPKPGTSITVTRRHPFTLTRRQAIDVEAATFDLDPLLLFVAILAYTDFPHLRAELEGPTAPDRLTDPSVLLAGVDLRTDLKNFRPERPKH